MNQHHLMTALARVREALELHAAKGGRTADSEVASKQAPKADAGGRSAPPALETLCSTLGLSEFERDVLMLCAGMELEGSFAGLCAKAQGDPGRAYPTFGLALAALPNPEWASLALGGRLRHWSLLEVGPGNAITSSPLRIDETVLHYLTGLRTPDERLAGLSQPVPAAGDLAPSHLALADEVATAWSKTAGSPAFPIVQLCGREIAGKRGVAAAVCERLGLFLERVPAAALPTVPADLHKLTRLWNRQSLLASGALLLDCDEVEPGDAVRDVPIGLLVDAYSGPLFVSSRKRRNPVERPVLTIDVERPLPAEQRAFWEALLGDAGDLDGHVERLVAQFDLGLPMIRAATAGALGRASTGDSPPLGESLWHSCRVQARPRLDDLAERIRRAATWEQLVLPVKQRRILEEIAAQVRHQSKVYESWGFSNQSSRGLGISALFSGASGTGKTMAAEVLGRELDLDLYRIDLSSVVSKYIGETEKNLARVFDAAEEGGAILLFDEADALFGKRSQIKDSHDRYANVEVSYLLQRMESYRGLAVLTTNMRDALDEAFLRRLRFIVDFPFPDQAERAQIWARVFPQETPTEGLDVAKLARLSVAGGNIRNIALNAAFLAAAAEKAIGMEHLLLAAQSEYEKVQKTLPQSEVRDWV
jgi:hypothetical protein